MLPRRGLADGYLFPRFMALESTPDVLCHCRAAVDHRRRATVQLIISWRMAGQPASQHKATAGSRTAHAAGASSGGVGWGIAAPTGDIIGAGTSLVLPSLRS